MTSPIGAPSAPTSPQPAPSARFDAAQLRPLLIASGVLLLAFALPLYQLVRFSLSSSLLSYIPLIPVVCGYLVWLKRDAVPPRGAPDIPLAALFAMGGIVALACSWVFPPSHRGAPSADSLALITLSFVLLFYALCSYFLGRAVLRTLRFPLFFLIFLVPLPTAWVDQIESVLQHGSAEVAYALFQIRGTPVLRNDLVFMLPGITLEVAPECSGIHSSLVLALTSLVAAHLFLRPGWKRPVLVFVVLPLALMRNGLRIFVIGELCVRVSPDMIHSMIHQRGGPLFFALSLIPLGLLLYFFVRSDRRPAPTQRPS